MADETGGPDILWLIKNDDEVRKAIMELVEQHRHSTFITGAIDGQAVQVDCMIWGDTPQLDRPPGLTSLGRT